MEISVYIKWEMPQKVLEIPTRSYLIYTKYQNNSLVIVDLGIAGKIPPNH